MEASKIDDTATEEDMKKRKEITDTQPLEESSEQSSLIETTNPTKQRRVEVPQIPKESAGGYNNDIQVEIPVLQGYSNDMETQQSKQNDPQVFSILNLGPSDLIPPVSVSEEQKMNPISTTTVIVAQQGVVPVLPIATPMTLGGTNGTNNETNTTTIEGKKAEETTGIVAENVDQTAEDIGFTSKYHGVSRHKKGKQWRLQIRPKHISLYFKTELDAAKEYDNLVRQFELKSPLNFPTEKEIEDGRSIEKKRKSKYRGVNIHKRSKKWRSTIFFNGIMKHIGYYNSEVEAAKAYDKAVIDSKVDNRELNFPAEYPDYYYIRGVTKRKRAPRNPPIEKSGPESKINVNGNEGTGTQNEGGGGGVEEGGANSMKKASNESGGNSSMETNSLPPSLPLNTTNQDGGDVTEPLHVPNQHIMMNHIDMVVQPERPTPPLDHDQTPLLGSTIYEAV